MRKTALGRDYIFGNIVYFQWLRGQDMVKHLQSILQRDVQQESRKPNTR